MLARWPLPLRSSRVMRHVTLLFTLVPTACVHSLPVSDISIISNLTSLTFREFERLLSPGRHCNYAHLLVFALFPPYNGCYYYGQDLCGHTCSTRDTQAHASLNVIQLVSAVAYLKIFCSGSNSFLQLT